MSSLVTTDRSPPNSNNVRIVPTKKRKKNANQISITHNSLPMPAKSRITRELSLLSKDPPPGIACYPAPLTFTSTKSSSTPSTSTSSTSSVVETLTNLHATIVGPPSSPFSGGIFLLSIRIPQRYPFEPPRIRFRTPLHHPNIDSAGRICLDTLKSPPAGNWNPAVSLPSLLLTLRTLMSEPNAEDGLVAEITSQYGRDYDAWWSQAEALTKKEATDEKLRAMEDGTDCNSCPSHAESSKTETAEVKTSGEGLEGPNSSQIDRNIKPRLS